MWCGCGDMCVCNALHAHVCERDRESKVWRMYVGMKVLFWSFASEHLSFRMFHLPVQDGASHLAMVFLYLCKTEIYHLHIPVLLHKHIQRLKAPMQDPTRSANRLSPSPLPSTLSTFSSIFSFIEWSCKICLVNRLTATSRPFQVPWYTIPKLPAPICNNERER